MWTPTKSWQTPKNKGLLCTRSGSHPYNLSLFGAMNEHLGSAATETWLKVLASSMARKSWRRYRPDQGDSLRRMRRRP